MRTCNRLAPSRGASTRVRVAARKCRKKKTLDRRAAFLAPRSPPPPSHRFIVRIITFRLRLFVVKGQERARADLIIRSVEKARPPSPIFLLLEAASCIIEW